MAVLQRGRDERLPRFIDGACPYRREHLAPRNPLSFGTQLRAALPVGESMEVAVFSTMGY